VLFPVDTFQTGVGALALWRVQRLRARLLKRLVADRTQLVVTLMPHVWDPLVSPLIRQAGVRHAVVIHDAEPHPGDPHAYLHRWLLREAGTCDLVCTLSAAVADRLAADALVPKSKIVTLFHPDLLYGPRTAPQPLEPGQEFRLLFLGRILPYKGLPVLVDAVRQLRGRGIPVKLGVFGEGPLGSLADELRSLGAEIINRWLDDAEIAALLARFHVVMLPHTAASQSGVAATAFGSGLPVIATPVGGLTEQVIDHVNGLIAERSDAESLASAIEHLYRTPALYRSMCDHIQGARASRSMQRFLADIIAHTT